MRKKEDPTPTPLEEKIKLLLETGPMNHDELVKSANVRASEINNALQRMMMRGAVKWLNAGKYCKPGVESPVEITEL